MSTVRLTTALALVGFLANQYVARDGIEGRCFGIFGHGNVAGMGRALQQYPDELPYRRAQRAGEGYHTVPAPPGHDPDAMAGSTREWRFENDPQHERLF